MRESEAVLTADLERRAGAGVKRYTTVADLCQEVLGRMSGILAQLVPSSTWDDLEALLHTHARWAVQNAARSRRRFDGESVAGAGTGPHEAPGHSETGQVTRADETAWVLARIDELPEELRAVARLRLEGASFSGIAEELSIAEGTARKRFLQAARALGKPR